MARKNTRNDLVDGSWIWKLDREHWRMLLAPHAAFFAQRGLALDAKVHDSDWVAEVHALCIKHEHELPGDLVEAFTEIIPLSTEAAQAEFRRLAEKHKLDLGPHPERLSEGELAVRFYLHHREHFMSVYAHKFTSQPTNFSEFFDLSRAGLEGRFTRKRMDLFNKGAGKLFEGRNGTDYSEVLFTESDAEVSLLVTHGDAIRSISVIRAETRRREQIRFIPNRHDIIHIEKGTGRLSINTAGAKDVDGFRKLVGLAFFDDPEQFSATASYTGSPILIDGRKALSKEGIPELEYVKLLGLVVTGPTGRRRKRKLAFDDGEIADIDLVRDTCVRHGVNHVESVKLSLKLASWKKELQVNIKSGNKLSVGKRAGLDVVYRFLKLRGFSIPPSPLPTSGYDRAA